MPTFPKYMRDAFSRCRPSIIQKRRVMFLPPPLRPASLFFLSIRLPSSRKLPFSFGSVRRQLLQDSQKAPRLLSSLAPSNSDLPFPPFTLSSTKQPFSLAKKTPSPTEESTPTAWTNFLLFSRPCLFYRHDQPRLSPTPTPS